MARARWCKTDGCEERAMPNTVPPACETHNGEPSEVDERPMCEGKTKFNKPCSYRASEGDTLCTNHRKMENGEFHLEKSPQCKYSKIKDGKGRTCSRKAHKGYDVCAGHIEDPEERRKARRQQEIARMTGNDRMQAILLGELDISELDDEELLRGQLKDVNGRFTGRQPKLIPREIHDKMVSELFRRADNQLRSRLFDVVNTMLDIATNPEESAKDRRAAAVWVFERLRGKTPEVLEVKQERPFEIIMTKITAGPRNARSTRGSSALAMENVQEAEIVEDEED